MENAKFVNVPSARLMEMDVASGNSATGLSCVPLISAVRPARPINVTLFTPETSRSLMFHYL